jgi:hypothetical protein
METPVTPAFRQPTAVERLFNRCFGFLVGLGLGMKHNYLLQVRGRKSGKLYSTPIDLLEIEGKRFLIAPRGRTQWVRNAEAAGEVALKRGSFRRTSRNKVVCATGVRKPIRGWPVYTSAQPPSAKVGRTIYELPATRQPAIEPVSSFH